MREEPNIKKQRARINAIDYAILEKLRERGMIAKEIGKIKRKEGKEIYHPQREKEIIERLTHADIAPFSKESIEFIYQEIILNCRNLEQLEKIAFLGPKNTWSHLAAKQYFGKSATLLPYEDFVQIFSSVEKGIADYGIVPIENSIEGDISSVLDEFAKSPLKVIAEIISPINHCLSSKRSKKNIKSIYSHAQAFGQCRHWIMQNFPKAKLIETSSTANAAKMASNSFWGTSAALTTRAAAMKNGLKIHEEKTQDSSNNCTKFFVISRNPNPLPENRCISVMLSIPHHSGSLSEILEIFKKHEVNLTKITSRPSRQEAWKYFFFINFEGNIDSPSVKNIFQELEKRSIFLKVLGSF